MINANVCLLILQLVVANSKHLKFSAVPSQINLHLIHLLQNIMEDFYFHQYHSSLFVVVKIVVMKRNNESTDLDRLRLSDSMVTSCVSPAHWFVKTVFSR